MDLKKIIPILAIMAMIGIFLVAMQPANAATTGLIVYHHGTFLGTEMSIKKGEKLDLIATLSVDGRALQPLRYINLYIRNSKDILTHKDESFTGIGGYSYFNVDTSKWACGNYKMLFIYWGSHDGEWPIAKKIVKLQITE
jgi:hypothetical protein